MVREGYKKTKFGFIPEDWEFLQLKDIANINMGSSPPSSTYNENGEGLPFFQGNAEFGSIYPEENQWCTEPQKIADKENILISVRAPVGDINIAPYKCCIGRGLAAIEGEKTSNKYIYYYLEQFKPKLQSYSQGSTFSSINQKVLKTFFINHPPLLEQKKIASILSSVDKTIAKTDEVIEKTKELKKGLMQQLLTKGIGHSEFKEVRVGPINYKIPINWEVKQLGKISKVKRGASPRPISSDKWFNKNSEIGWVRISDITSAGKYLKETEQYLSKEGIEKSRKANKGEVILSICATVGKPSILGINTCIHDGLVLFRDNEDDISNEFLYYVLLRNQQILKSKGQTGTQVNLNTSIVKRTKILLPPLEEQKKIASILSSVDEKIKKEEEYKAKLERLKKGLMQKLLTGEIRVNTESEV